MTASFPQRISNDQRGKVLDIVWDDGTSQQLPHALLRARCKCTVCQAQRLRAAGKAAGPVQDPEVRVDELRQVGLYGLQLIFSDGHERGIYPWAYLRELNDVQPTPA
jgi:DUF971 family protein